MTPRDRGIAAVIDAYDCLLETDEATERVIKTVVAEGLTARQKIVLANALVLSVERHPDP